MCSSLQANKITENYSVEFGIIGEIAKVHAIMDIKKNNYVVEAKLRVIGAIANKVTENLKEISLSKGHIVKGKYITDKYQMIKSYGVFSSTTIINKLSPEDIKNGRMLNLSQIKLYV